MEAQASRPASGSLFGSAIAQAADNRSIGGARSQSAQEDNNATTREPSAAQRAATALQELRATTRAALGSSRDAKAATVAATEQLAALMQGQPPDVQAAILRGARAEIGQLTKQLQHLGRNETNRAISALAQVAESAGSENVALLTDTMSRSMPEVVAGDAGIGRNAMPRNNILSALGDAIEGGGGALLATAMARSLEQDGHEDFALAVHKQAAASVQRVHSRWQEAKDKVDARNGELAAVSASWSGAFDEDARAAGAEAFLANHAETYEDLDKASAVLAATLEGASYGLRKPSGLDEAQDGGAFRMAMNAIPDLARTEAGSAVVVDAMARSAAGHDNFLDVERNRRSSLVRASEHQNGWLGRSLQGAAQAHTDALDQTLLEATATQTDAATRRGDLGAVGAMLSDFAAFTDDRTLSDAAKEVQEEMQASWQEFEAGGGIIGGLDAMGSLKSLQSSIGKAFAQVGKSRLGGNPAMQARFESIGASFTVGSTISAYAALAEDPNLQSFLSAGGATAGTLDKLNPKPSQQTADGVGGATKLGRIASGAGLVGSGLRSIQNPASVRAHLETVSSAAGFAHAGGLLGSRAVLSQAAKKAGVVAAVVFSAWDTWDAYQNGDLYGAAASAAPLVGLGIGASIGAAGGPVGAMAGMAIGAVVGVGMELIRAFTRKDPILQFEQRTQPFLQGALQAGGMSSAEAKALSHRFRDVNDDLVGVGPVLAGLSATLGVSSPTMLDWAAGLRDGDAHRLAKFMLQVDHSGNDAWQKLQAEPNPSISPHDPLQIGLDQNRMDALAAWVQAEWPDGPWRNATR